MDVPPPSDHPSAAMWNFIRGPALKDIQPSEEGFWALAGHDNDTFRLLFVHPATLTEPEELSYRVFRPLRTVMEVEKHAPGLVYQYEGEETTIPQIDGGFAPPEDQPDRAVHITQPLPPGILHQEYNIDPPGFALGLNIPPYYQIQSGTGHFNQAQSIMPQMTPDLDQQLVAHAGAQQIPGYGDDQQPQQVVNPMGNASWVFTPTLLQSQNGHMGGVSSMIMAGAQATVQNGELGAQLDLGDQNMHQDGEVDPVVWQNQIWEELPDGDDEAGDNGDEHMVLPGQ